MSSTGPNDLGKSTVGDALRSVLLMRPTSSHADPYRPWGVNDANPRVVLELDLGPIDQPERLRVTKTFVKGSPKASLERRAGDAWTLIKAGKAVDEELRRRLAWGLESNNVHGEARSFLTTTLLSKQAEVDAILGASVDDTASVQDVLVAALGALGQDPVVTGLLRELAAEVDEVFTSSGAWRSGADRIRTRDRSRLNELEARLHESLGKVEQVRIIERDLKSALDVRDHTAFELARTRDGRDRQARRREAADRLEQLRARLDLARSLSAAQAALAEVGERTRAQEHKVAELKKALQVEETELDAAQVELEAQRIGFRRRKRQPTLNDRKYVKR
jgi:anti-sigma28 factor (negative regulator of flagellin synthesis)